MSELFKAIQLAIACSVPVSIMGMAAYLIYKQVDGWGWFLVCALMLAGAFSVKVD